MVIKFRSDLTLEETTYLFIHYLIVLVSIKNSYNDYLHNDFSGLVLSESIRKKQKTINVERLLVQGFDPDDIEDIVSRKLIELDESVVGIEFILNVQTIADFVQPETDKLLNGL